MNPDIQAFVLAIVSTIATPVIVEIARVIINEIARVVINRSKKREKTDEKPILIYPKDYKPPSPKFNFRPIVIVTVLSVFVVLPSVFFLARSYLQPPTGQVISLPTPALEVNTSITPTPGPTPISLGTADEIRRDDFSSTNTGWDNYSTSKVATGYDNGRYFIQLSDFVLFLSVWKQAGMIDNGVLQVDVIRPSDGNEFSTQGIGFGWQNGWEGSTYAFEIDWAGNCKFLEAFDGWRVLTSSKITGFEKNRNYHTLRVYIKGDEATGYVDDVYCAKQTLTNYQRGYVGVVASPSISTESGKFYFDEYRIFRLP